MKNYYTKSYSFSLTILLLLFLSSGSFANINYSKFVKGGSNILTFNSKGSNKTMLLAQASTPSSSPSAGTYIGTQLVTITTASSGASIRYTTDGTDPSSTVGTLYSGPVSISSNTILKSIAYGPGYSDSPVASGNYVINCETPTLSPTTGTYDSGLKVTMSSATTGANIYYTTDGSVPTAASTPYSSRITLLTTTTLRVIAIKNGMGNSLITREDYTIRPPVAAPTYTPVAGTYNAVQNVTIASATPGATIYYTTDGSAPTISSTPYTGPVPVGTNLTIKAFAVNSGMTDSPVTTSDYIIALPVATPTFTPVAGNYNSIQSVTIASATPGATIHYTTDGTAPTASSPTYIGPVTVNATSTIKAFATKNGMSDSPVNSADYIIVLPTAAPTFTPAGGTYPSAQSVTIASTTPGATIHYTTDGSTPTASSPTYSGPVTVNATSTIKAFAMKSGMSDSPVSSADYSINSPAAAPTFTPTASTYPSAQSVTIASTTPGATIYYTIDGSTPTPSSLQYSVPINIGVNTVVKAIAVKNGMSDSPVTSGNYVINLTVVAPTFDIPAGTYNVVQSVSITSATQGATIYFTTDGSTPTSTSPQYNGPITISATTIVKAIAEKSGMSNSSVTSANYVIALSAATPTFTPAAGTYPLAQSVTIASSTQGATIYYTTDGSAPSISSQQYSGPVNIGANTTLNAIAIKGGMGNSAVYTGNYVIQPVVEAPAFDIPGGTYTTAKSITITTLTPNAKIYYTTDGNPPTTSSPQYNGPINIGTSTTLSAIAVITGMPNSTTTTAAYTIQFLKTANPLFSPAPGSFTTPQSITISSATAGATIRYTTDGTTPSQTIGTVYSVPITISATTSFKAIAYMTGFLNSDVTDAAYTTDSDGDGVSDNEDEYPLDPLRSSNNLFPARGFGSLAFEDNWPLKADYDMNDMVIDYQFNQVTNATNDVVEIKAKIVLRAMGTTLHNGFGIELPVTPSQITSCVVKLGNGTDVPFGKSVTINAKGLEESPNPNAIVILFDDGFKLFPQITPGTFVNTSPNMAWTKPDTLNMTITFTQPVRMDVFAGSRVYNPFIFKDQKRSTEIHLPDFPPTSLADMTLFNTAEDKSDPSNGKYYKTANNLPWALNIYEEYSYPVEKTSIMNAFLHFTEWAKSNGVLFPDWYKLKDGYRKSNTIYTHP